MALWRFEWDCGRQGSLEGVFQADSDEIVQAIGQSVYFGEVLGKHSDIHGILEAEDFEMLTDDQDFIDKVTKYNLIPSGYNPFHYMDE